MHIPKTGGSTIEFVNMMHPPGERLFQSHLASEFDKIATMPAYQGVSAFELFNKTRTSFRANNFFLSQHSAQLQWWEMPGQEWCLDHAPPVTPELIRYYTGRCDVFCAVREPVERLLSEYRYMYFHGLPPYQGPYYFPEPECSASGFEEFVPLLFADLRRSLYQSLCMLVPQSVMVFGRPDTASQGHQFCKHILRQENLTAGFNHLMQEYGLDAQLDDVPQFMHADQCSIDIAEVSQQTKDLIYDFYRADYKAFGYLHP